MSAPAENAGEQASRNARKQSEQELENLVKEDKRRHITTMKYSDVVTYIKYIAETYFVKEKWIKNFNPKNHESDDFIKPIKFFAYVQDHLYDKKSIEGLDVKEFQKSYTSSKWNHALTDDLFELYFLMKAQSKGTDAMKRVAHDAWTLSRIVEYGDDGTFKSFREDRSEEKSAPILTASLFKNLVGKEKSDENKNNIAVEVPSVGVTIVEARRIFQFVAFDKLDNEQQLLDVNPVVALNYLKQNFSALGLKKYTNFDAYFKTEFLNRLKGTHDAQQLTVKEFVDRMKHNNVTGVYYWKEFKYISILPKMTEEQMKADFFDLLKSKFVYLQFEKQDKMRDGCNVITPTSWMKCLKAPQMVGGARPSSYKPSSQTVLYNKKHRKVYTKGSKRYVKLKNKNTNSFYYKQIKN